MSEQSCLGRSNFRTDEAAWPVPGGASKPGRTPAPALEELGTALKVLRTIRDLTQEQVAAAAGTRKSWVCRVEQAQVNFSLENLGGLVAAMELPLSALGEAVRLLRLVRTPRLTRDGGRAAAPSGTQALLRAAGTLPGPGAELAEAAARLVLKRLHEGGPCDDDQSRREPEAARRRAEEVWERLRALSAGERRALVGESVEFQGWALCERVCNESAATAAHDARSAIALAILAVRIALRWAGEESWGRRLEGYARAHLANGWRVAGQLVQADRILGEALRLWESGAPADPAPLDAARLLDLAASLRRDQRRLPESLELLDRGLALHPAGAAAVRLLLIRSKTLEEMGDHERAAVTLGRAAALLDGASEPRARLIVRFNLAWNLYQLGRADEAERLLPEVRALAGELGNHLDLVRLRWLEGHVAAVRDRKAEAVAAFEQVRSAFRELKVPYDEALATLDLALLYTAQGGRAAEVKALAAEAAEAFEAVEVDAEVRKALALFQHAAEEERVTAELARALAACLARARHDPGACSPRR